MKATLLVRTRVVRSERSFSEIVVWKLPKPMPGSWHSFKYRLAYVVDGTCVLRYDNESGKGDHRHFGDMEQIYKFITPDKVVADFEGDIERWDRENGRS